MTAALKVLFWTAVFSGPAAIVLYWVAALSPAAVETAYSRAVYPFLMQPWSRLTGLVPFALTPWLALALVTAAVWCFFAVPPPRALALVGAGLSTVLAWFVLGWGLNYQRQSWARSHGWSAPGGSAAELEALAEKLVVRVDALRARLADPVPLKDFWTSASARRAVVTAYERTGRSDPLLAGRWGGPKLAPFGSLMSWLGLSGIFLPFLGEPLVNAGPDDWQLPFTMAHESAHLRGWAREDEANFLAFWVLRDDADPAMAYSAWGSALLYAASALQGTALGQAAWRRVAADLSPEVKQDWKRSFAYWDRFQGPVSDTAGAINDAYLKTQGQTDGVRSYGRMVDLLLASQNLW